MVLQGNSFPSGRLERIEAHDNGNRGQKISDIICHSLPLHIICVFLERTMCRIPSARGRVRCHREVHVRRFETYRSGETHGMLRMPGCMVRRSSEELGWGCLYASLQWESPFRKDFDAVDDQLIVWHRNGPVHIAGQGGGKAYSEIMPPGSIHLIPGGAEFSVDLGAEVETLHIYLRRELLQEVAHTVLGRAVSDISIQPRLLHNDPVLRSMLETINTALDPAYGFSNPEVDYLARTIGAHLVRRYSNIESASSLDPFLHPQENVSSGLTAAVEFMTRNIDTSIRVEDVAEAARTSVGHLTREFRAHFGTPPHRYLIKLRVNRARDLLASTDLPIAVIAYECGFAHQEHLTRHFKRELDATPAAYRRFAGGKLCTTGMGMSAMA